MCRMGWWAALLGGLCSLSRVQNCANAVSAPLLQCLGAQGAWLQHLHPLSHSSYPVLCLCSAKGSFSAGKTCPGGFPSAFSPGHAQITPWMAVTDPGGGLSEPLFLLSLSWRGQAQTHVLTPGIQLVVLCLAAGCSLSCWDSVFLLVANLLFAFGARQICPWALLGQTAPEPPSPEVSSRLFC